jgi:phosphoglycolate phosphatase-like HAD superfamily hydrolase
MVGDMHSDILMGKAVGALTIGVTTGLFSRQMLIEIDPDFIFDSVADISDNIKKIKEKIKN